jgi:hypothetical protein
MNKDLSPHVEEPLTKNGITLRKGIFLTTKVSSTSSTTWTTLWTPLDDRSLGWKPSLANT